MEKHFPPVPVMLCFFETSPEKHRRKGAGAGEKSAADSGGIRTKRRRLCFQTHALEFKPSFLEAILLLIFFLGAYKKTKKRGQH